MSLGIYFYVPNLIGYARIIFMFIAYYFANNNPLYFFIFYALSQGFDMLDGFAARALNQATKFGAMLDMVTDRCSTVGLLLVLSQREKKYTILCHLFIWIDIFSHWTHTLASIQSGASSHKEIKKGPWLLEFYYKVKLFMVFLIIGAEGYPLSLYLLSFKSLNHIIKIILKNLNYFLLPLFLTKHYINIIQFFYAANTLDKPKTT